MKTYLKCLILATIAFGACNKKKEDKIPNPPPPTPTDTTKVTYNYTSDYAYNLNVVYFVPKDVAKPADYHRRISEILLSAQEFVRKEMIRNGYADKTFGLLTDKSKGRIKLIEITGSQGKSAYPYNGGANAIRADIDNYQSTHQSEFTGDHCLVITAATTYDANGEPGGVPFYGLGKYCYALDYADQDIKYLGTSGTLGDRATKWIGGMVHELGHGLNLPHDRQKVISENSLGMSLMWAGNFTWGNAPTFLTNADCAVLNVNQIFSKVATNFYGQVDAAVLRINATFNAAKQAIILKGKFTSSVPVTDVLYFNDPNVNNEGPGGDYNSIAWRSKPIGTDSFYVEMPIEDLDLKTDNIPYDLKVKLVHNNGTVTTTGYTYTFLGGVPILNFSTRTEISKTGWSVISFSSEETSGEGAVNGRVATLIDGNVATFWHSQWTGAGSVYPHQFIIDMGSIKTATGFSINQREGLNRAIKNAELFVSTDGINYSSTGSVVFENASGSQYFNFSSAKTFRYFKLVANSAWDGLQFGALAEIGMY